MKQYPIAIAELIPNSRLPVLGPGTPDGSVHTKLVAIKPESLGIVQNRSAAMACLSGLWLLHDYLDESHTISQDISQWYGSHWHAIMHRREPDAWNSKYWWQRVGRSPIFREMIDQSPAIGYTYSTPNDFVDFCERHRDTGSAEEMIARRVQLLEWRLLFDWCFREAIG